MFASFACPLASTRITAHDRFLNASGSVATKWLAVRPTNFHPSGPVGSGIRDQVYGKRYFPYLFAKNPRGKLVEWQRRINPWFGCNENAVSEVEQTDISGIN